MTNDVKRTSASRKGGGGRWGQKLQITHTHVGSQTAGERDSQPCAFHVTCRLQAVSACSMPVASRVNVHSSFGACSRDRGSDRLPQQRPEQSLRRKPRTHDDGGIQSLPSGGGGPFGGTHPPATHHGDRETASWHESGECDPSWNANGRWRAGSGGRAFPPPRPTVDNCSRESPPILDCSPKPRRGCSRQHEHPSSASSKFGSLASHQQLGRPSYSWDGRRRTANTALPLRPTSWGPTGLPPPLCSQQPPPPDLLCHCVSVDEPTLPHWTPLPSRNSSGADTPRRTTTTSTPSPRLPAAATGTRETTAPSPPPPAASSMATTTGTLPTGRPQPRTSTPLPGRITPSHSHHRDAGIHERSVGDQTDWGNNDAAATADPWNEQGQPTTAHTGGQQSAATNRPPLTAGELGAMFGFPVYDQAGNLIVPSPALVASIGWGGDLPTHLPPTARGSQPQRPAQPQQQQRPTHTSATPSTPTQRQPAGAQKLKLSTTPERPRGYTPPTFGHWAVDHHEGDHDPTAASSSQAPPRKQPPTHQQQPPRPTASSDPTGTAQEGAGGGGGSSSSHQAAGGAPAAHTTTSPVPGGYTSLRGQGGCQG